MKEKLKNRNKGITLIALIITIIVMLILVATAVSVAINSGLFEKAGEATGGWKLSQEEENNLKVNIAGTEYNTMEEYVGTLNETGIPWIYEQNEDGDIEITGIDFSDYITEVEDDGYSVFVKIEMGTEVLKVPGKLNGKDVVSFSLEDSFALDNTTYGSLIDVKKIILERNIESVGDLRANLVSYYNMESIDLPNTVTSIEGTTLFSEMSVVNFPNGVSEELEIATNKWGADMITVEGVEYSTPITFYICYTIGETKSEVSTCTAEFGETLGEWITNKRNTLADESMLNFLDNVCYLRVEMYGYLDSLNFYISGDPTYLECYDSTGNTADVLTPIDYYETYEFVTDPGMFN